MSLLDAIRALNDLGILAVIPLGALIGLSVGLYRRFRSGGGAYYGPGYREPGHTWTEQDYYDFAMRPGQYD